MRCRYARWSGTQDPFPAEVSADEVLDAVGDDLVEGASPDQALSRLARRGLPGQARGLDELRQQVLRARQRELSRLGVEEPLRRVAERLAEILDRERAALAFSADADAAADKAARLDSLPEDTAARLAELEGYPWEDPGAAAEFQELMEQLRRDVAEATFGRLAGALESATQADLSRMRDLLADLNALVDRRDRGEDVSDDFAALKERYRDLLPTDADTLDELLDELARRMAAMSRLAAGMDPDQRALLAQLAEEALGDMGLRFEASRLEQALRSRTPGLGWDRPVQGAMPTGEQGGSLADTVDWVEHLQSYEDLAAALGQDYPGARLEDVDEDELRRLLGDAAVRDLRALREAERALERAGAASRRQGRLELTPQGVRRLGERSLARIYERAVSGATGTHPARSAGGDGEPTGTTRPLRFGDPFRLDIARTVGNAVMRTAGEQPTGDAPPAAGPPIELRAEDFALAEAERRVRSATVLLLDMSFSMPLRGNWGPAKRVALALQSLTSSKFPEDAFYVVGFSDYARRLTPRDLLSAGWERVYGTNMQHAFMIARRLLGAHAGDERQVLMVTDGEPTAHLDGDTPVFAWPPERRTLELTMAEAARLSRTGATLNVFLLDHDPGAAAFVERMVSGYGGRILYPDLEDLGHLVVRDFLRGRRAA